MTALGPYQRQVLKRLYRAIWHERSPGLTMGELIDLDDLGYDRKTRERRLSSLMSLETRGLVRGRKLEKANRPTKTVFVLTPEGERLAQL